MAHCCVLSDPALSLKHLRPVSPPPNRLCISLPRVYPVRSAPLCLNPDPSFSFVRTFAPATVANLGPGFDFLGCAVDGLGDHVSVRLDPSVPPGEIFISEISGASALSKNPKRNCAGIAAMAAMEMLGVRSVGLSLSLEKGLPLGSGLGSSAASAAAAAVAVNELFGGKLGERELVLAGLESEVAVSGRHADNIAPAIMGSFVLIGGYDPLKLRKLEYPSGSKPPVFVLVNPIEFEAPTKQMRAALAPEVAREVHVWNSSQAAELVAALLTGDLPALGQAMSSDRVVEPRRGPLIPGFASVKEAAIAGGAFGCTISGAGPTIVALTDSEDRGAEIGKRMVEAFWNDGGLKARTVISKLDVKGARLVSSIPIF